VALSTSCIKNIKLKIIEIKTGCQYSWYFYYSENLNWAAQNPRLGRMLAAGWTYYSCITTKTKFGMVRVESKTIHTADVSASATLPWWCQWRNKPSILFELRHVRRPATTSFRFRFRVYV